MALIYKWNIHEYGVRHHWIKSICYTVRRFLDKVFLWSLAFLRIVLVSAMARKMNESPQGIYSLLIICELVYLSYWSPNKAWKCYFLCGVLSCKTSISFPFDIPNMEQQSWKILTHHFTTPPLNTTAWNGKTSSPSLVPF